MKKILTCCLLLVFGIGLLVSTGFTQDAKTIVEKVIEAQGGRKLLASIKDTTTVASMDLTQMGISGSGSMYTKEPNLMRLDMEFMGMLITQAFDGKIAWTTNPQTGAAQELPDEIAVIMANSSYGNSAFLNPDKFGITYKFKGKESIQDKEYLVLDRVYSDGYIITFYIDPDSYLIYKTKQDSIDEMGASVVEESVLTDYKEVNGMMVAHTVTIMRDETEFGILAVTEISFNSGLEDSFFKMDQ